MKYELKRGFSLIEVLIVVAIATSVVLIVANFGNNITGLNSLVSSELQSKSDVNISLQTIVAEIQSASGAENGAFAIDSVGTSSFAFYSDLHKNGITERVRYYYATSTIYQGIINPTGTPATYPTSSEIVIDFIDHVIISTSTPLFSYYNTSYTGTQSPMTYPIALASIRLVGISFSTQSNVTSSQKSPLQYFYSIVDIRNLDSN